MKTKSKERRQNNMEYDWINMILEDDNKVFNVLETYLELMNFSELEPQKMIKEGTYVV